jgi:hypothetical protein
VSTNGRLAKSGNCRGTACRAPTLCVPTGRCARLASPIRAGDGPPARSRRHDTTRAGLGPAPTSTSTIHHSLFAIRWRCGAAGRSQQRCAPTTWRTWRKGGSRTRPYLDQHHSLFARSGGCLRTRPPIRRIGRIANLRRSPVLHRTSRDSPSFFHSLFAIRHSPFLSPFAIRNSRFDVWRNPVAVGARHAVPLPFAYPQVGVHDWPRPPARAMGRRQDAGATTQPGAGLGPAPTSTSTIHHSVSFSARHSPRAMGVHERLL